MYIFTLLDPDAFKEHASELIPHDDTENILHLFELLERNGVVIYNDKVSRESIAEALAWTADYDPEISDTITSILENFSTDVSEFNLQGKTFDDLANESEADLIITDKEFDFDDRFTTQNISSANRLLAKNKKRRINPDDCNDGNPFDFPQAIRRATRYSKRFYIRATFIARNINPRKICILNKLKEISARLRLFYDENNSLEIIENPKESGRYNILKLN